MLVLSRKLGESIMVAGGIEILILKCSRGGVRIGLRAPAETRILRSELQPLAETQPPRIEPRRRRTS
ncbi:MAG: carbon storage regulator [Pirellulaceae bacterium]